VEDTKIFMNALRTSRTLNACMVQCMRNFTLLYIGDVLTFVWRALAHKGGAFSISSR